MALANYYLNEMNNKEMCLNVLKTMEQRIPRENVMLDYRLTYNIATSYLGAGDMNTFKTLAQEIEREALKKIADKPRDVSGYYNPYTILKMTYENGGEYDKEIDLLKRLQTVTGPSQEINSEIERVKHLKDSSSIKK